MKARAIVLFCIAALLLSACAPARLDLSGCFSEADVIAEGVEIRGYARDGVVYVSADELGGLLPEFSWKKDIFGTVTLQSVKDRRKIAYTWTDGSVSADRALRLSSPDDLLVSLDTLDRLPSLQIMRDPETGVSYISHGLNHNSITPGVTVPVLMYHCISDDIFGYEPLFVSPDDFRAQMNYLLDHGYTPILFSDLARLEDYDKPVIITVDDGYEDNYTEMLPILRELGIKVSVFMISSFIGNQYYLNADQMRQMRDSGLVEFQSHTYEHLHLSDHGPEEQKQTMLQSRLAIARAIGLVPYVLSYPQGLYNQNTESLASNYYSLGCRTANELWVTDTGYYHVNRLTVSRGITIDEFAALLEP